MHLFVDNLTNVDFSYLHPERGLVGETWLASVVLEGALDEQGMVCDFGLVKKTLRRWLDDTIDHCLLVAKEASCLDQLKDEEQIEIVWSVKGNKSYSIQCNSPAQAITLIDTENIDPDSVALWCVKQLREELPDTIDRIQLKFVPENITEHYYHYSHGLKKHDGNCQRIAHGHRSTIEIYRDDNRISDIEAKWCKQWEDIYIGTAEDLIKTDKDNGVEYHTFAYQAQQGHFHLRLPAQQCYLIDTDSTVEFIAQHIAGQLKQNDPKHRYHVKAFEGIGKGALAFSDT